MRANAGTPLGEWVPKATPLGEWGYPRRGLRGPGGAAGFGFVGGAVEFAELEDDLDGAGLHNTQSVPTVVSAVASDVRDNAIRVELALDPSLPNATVLQHGQPGTIEIAVEETTPAILVLRMTGLVSGASR